ncbi:MAG: phosphoribosylanthranilate isomerase [Neolewinella sp.]
MVIPTPISTFAKNKPTMLATKVLASGITHLTDARYFASWEVDYLAFPIGEGVAESISWDYLNALREWVAGPTIVAELGQIEDGAAWAELLQQQKVDTVLVSSAAPASAPEKLNEAGIKVIVHVPVAGHQSSDDVAETIADHPQATLILLDFEQGGITWNDLVAGHPFGLPALAKILNNRPCLLQISLDGANPQELKDTYPVAGFAVRGSSEEKVGYKGFDDLDDLFEGLEVFS